MEIVPGRAAYIAANLKAEGGIILGDALRLDALKLPQIDFSLTSPPYMQKVNHPEYPFAAYKITGQTYADYLSDIARIYKSLGARMRQGAYAVIEACNLEFDGVYTPLADDIARSVGRVLPLCGKIALKWTPARGDCYDHSIALVFRKGGA